MRILKLNAINTSSFENLRYIRYINNFILKNKYNQLKFIHLFNAKIINI